ncbi:hypothetical protein LPW39_13580 [Comamonas koreensis]|uniref:Uncharacterized protein n=1 Tax=Comamonas koreensis TaxID=160825 RepID=A0AAW4XZ79_9BURK|nr:hypothetical protein [Comamonas koreensis]MCD2166159.1 hypothetical protein [Comamonas koreensis]
MESPVRVPNVPVLPVMALFASVQEAAARRHPGGEAGNVSAMLTAANGLETKAVALVTGTLMAVVVSELVASERLVLAKVKVPVPPKLTLRVVTQVGIDINP